MLTFEPFKDEYDRMLQLDDWTDRLGIVITHKKRGSFPEINLPQFRETSLSIVTLDKQSAMELMRALVEPSQVDFIPDLESDWCLHIYKQDNNARTIQIDNEWNSLEAAIFLTAEKAETLNKQIQQWLGKNEQV